MKEARRLSAVNSIPSKSLKFVSSCLSSSARWFKCIYRDLRKFSVSYKIIYGVLTVVTYKIYFSLHYDLPYRIYQNVTNTNSKQHELLMD